MLTLIKDYDATGSVPSPLIFGFFLIDSYVNSCSSHLVRRAPWKPKSADWRFLFLTFREEVHRAAVAAPIAIFVAVVGTGLIGWLLNIVLVLCSGAYSGTPWILWLGDDWGKIQNETGFYLHGHFIDFCLRNQDHVHTDRQSRNVIPMGLGMLDCVFRRAVRVFPISFVYLRISNDIALKNGDAVVFAHILRILTGPRLPRSRSFRNRVQVDRDTSDCGVVRHDSQYLAGFVGFGEYYGVPGCFRSHCGRWVIPCEILFYTFQVFWRCFFRWTLALDISYIVPIFCRRWFCNHPDVHFTPGPFYMPGLLGWIANCICIAYVSFISTFGPSTYWPIFCVDGRSS